MNVGVLGGGQLGRMLALAGIPLGIRFRFFEDAASPPAGPLGQVVAGAYDDVEAALRFADGLDVVTYEFENVPVDTARALSRVVPVYPPPEALELAQDRLTEKEGFRSLGIPTADFRAVGSRTELERAVQELGLPAVLKTRRMGYDGKGQIVLRSSEDLPEAWGLLGERPLLLEAWVPYERELSVLAVRDREGDTSLYPLVETHHGEGILEWALAPAPGAAALHEAATDYAKVLMDRLGYVGVLAVELFDTKAGLLANEMAPRVHNSGHWTQDGAVHSQFENHMRAVCGLPLGSTEAEGSTAMVNLLGRVPPLATLLADAENHVHLYEKEPRPGRKLGHVNIRAQDPESLRASAERLRASLQA